MTLTMFTGEDVSVLVSAILKRNSGHLKYNNLTQVHK